MTIRRLRAKRFLKKLPFLLFLLAVSWTGAYLLGATAQDKAEIQASHKYDQRVFQAGPEHNIEYKVSNAAKKNLIVVSHGRSGSSLMGDIFNHHPSVFYMYEPLQTVERIHERFFGKVVGYTESNEYGRLADKYLNGLLRCKFDQPNVLEDLETYYRKQKHPRVSNAIASPPLCPYYPTDPEWDPRLCPPMTSESLGGTCRDNYDLTVLKILISRIPKNTIETILNACSSSDVDCKILFLMRDPRAVIPSSQSFGFFTNKGDVAKRGLRQYSYWRCKETEDNLDIIRKLPQSLRNRIRLQRYEDLAFDPLKALSGLYDFAGLPMLENVRTWLNETTRQNRRNCNEMDGEQATCTKDDAWIAANRWRWLVHPHDLEIIEHYCRDVMRMMGYRFVDNSYELLAERHVPLFTDNYEAKQWFSPQ